MAVVFSTSKRSDVEEFLRSLPSVLAGTSPDVHGVAEGMRARVGWTILSEVATDFEVKSRGGTGAGGIKWAPLSKQYLAYQRPVTGRKPPRGGRFAPGGKDGLLSKAQLTKWRKIYSRHLSYLILKFPEKDAKGRAASIAWKQIKSEGAKTKLEKFGNRKMGVDYQALVDTGTLRRSLLPGEVIEQKGGAAEYKKDDEEQEFRQDAVSVTVGTRIPYAGALHKKRPFWPEEFPSEWWDEILTNVATGITRVGELAEAGVL